MFEYENGENKKYVLDHPGFHDVCLNEWVPDIASLGLKTKNRRNLMRRFSFQRGSEDKIRVIITHYNEINNMKMSRFLNCLLARNNMMF